MNFYKAASAEYPELAYFMPTFLGTLQLDEQVSVATSANASAATSVTNLPQENGTDRLAGILPSSLTVVPASANPSLPHPTVPLLPLCPTSLPVPRSPLGHRRTPSPTLDPLLRIKGKPLSTDTSIVLAAETDGFSHPNVLDLKLGSRLWADDAPPAKRQRLDRVSNATTSGLLGFRIAGMRTWQGEKQQQQQQQQQHQQQPESTPSSSASDTAPVEEPASSGSSVTPIVKVTGNTIDAGYEDRQFEPETGYLVYNKLYGRSRTTADIRAAFREYFIVPSSGVDAKQALEVIRLCKEDVQEMQAVLEHMETRMYSSSILIVYEGDPEAWRKAVEWRRKARRNGEAGKKNENRAKVESDLAEIEDPDADADDEEEPNTHAVKLIDFAHAEFVPGAGPDENVLHGIRSTVRLLEELEAELKSGVEA